MANVTVFADASVKYTTRAAGFGGWAIKNNAPSVTVAGPLAYDKCVVLCELRAVVKTVYALRKQGYIQRGDHVLLQSDSISALSRIRQCGKRIGIIVEERTHPDSGHVVTTIPSTKVTEEITAACALLFKALAECTISVRFVKGHTNAESGGRYWVNNLCDTAAKKARQQEEARIKQCVCIDTVIDRKGGRGFICGDSAAANVGYFHGKNDPRMRVYYPDDLNNRYVVLSSSTFFKKFAVLD